MIYFNGNIYKKLFDVVGFYMSLEDFFLFQHMVCKFHSSSDIYFFKFQIYKNWYKLKET